MYTLSCAASYRFPDRTPKLPPPGIQPVEDAATTYVLALQHLPAGLAAISSDQALSLFSPERLDAGPYRALPTRHGNVGVLEPFEWGSSVVATAGEDGAVGVWDLRVARGESARIQASDTAPILSMACNGSTHTIAVGTELHNHSASICTWDIRANPSQQRQYSGVHSDDVTELSFDTANPSLLLSGSTDGLVNICDIRISDEDEAVVETFNHGSVHRAGYLGSDAVYALSHDERLALYSTGTGTSTGGNGGESTKGEEKRRDLVVVDFGDLREGLACRYVADISPKADGSGAVVGVGAQDREAFELVYLSRGEDRWSFSPDAKVRLDGAHGGEVVRSFCLFDQEQVVFSAGEDGYIKAWRPRPDSG